MSAAAADPSVFQSVRQQVPTTEEGFRSQACATLPSILEDRVRREPGSPRCKQPDNGIGLSIEKTRNLEEDVSCANSAGLMQRVCPDLCIVCGATSLMDLVGPGLQRLSETSPVRR